MKGIILTALLAIILIQVVEPASTKKSKRLKCHFCTSADTCKRFNDKECERNQDTCQRTHIPITSPSGNENRDNYYASTCQGIMVLERFCTTQTKCEAAKKKKHSRVTVECCKELMCNA